MASVAHARATIRILTLRLREYLLLDCRICRYLFATLGIVASTIYKILGLRLGSFGFLCAVHRSNYSRISDHICARLASRELGRKSDGHIGAEHIRTVAASPSTSRFFDQPDRLLGTRVLVLKSPGTNEQGILVIDYSFVFPLFAKLYDIRSIAARYFIVLEPSWSGYCDVDILSFAQYNFPVFVQSGEPRDTFVLKQLTKNLIPLPIAANWWVDHRCMRPLPGVSKDIDVVIVASWAGFKRHYRVFEVLRALRRRGHVLKVSLIGYPSELSRIDILEQADYFGVADQIDVHEWLSPAEVNMQFNRARVNLLWSRREGFNRAIVEGMLAGIPCVIRSGFNYGYRYPYINDQTGVFALEESLGDTLLEMCNKHAGYRPREWVTANMSCQIALQILTESVKALANGLKQRWTVDPVGKVGQLNSMMYWNEADRERFEDDYAFLRSRRIQVDPSHGSFTA